ncbi:hypothetical protein UA08_09175 [Talaromyces atroroseus]|uniref:NAD-dependent epimerase/dehydratase domain-containing protein n=1 Tax=Talaromyces atroroseus TaxID=1441469 RepID=A0A1Q5Q6V9_TALAT|nr:hypothetical protein UA08_09175 [Talaromyces atroroseus]OKL55584.1 hypothetical protein UA08_09175 [Talaromyces atroroseus]
MAPTKLLLTGATGYIGGTVLTQLLKSQVPDIQTLSVSALIRNPEQAELYASKGVTPILFIGLEDVEHLRRTASGYDIIIHAADSTSPAAVEALILGLADNQDTSKEKYFIHTSGTSSLGDRPITEKLIESREFSDKSDIYSYMKHREEIEFYAQRATDIKTVEAGEQAGVKTLVVKAPIIYGRGTGFFNKKSFHIPVLIQGAVAAGRAEYVAEGACAWDYVHVEDLAAFFELLTTKVLRNEVVLSGRKGIYFASTLRHSWKELAEVIGEFGYKLGHLTSPEPQSITLSEAAEKYTGGNEQLAEVGLASNSLTKSDLGQEIGWVSKKEEVDFRQSIVDDFDLLFGKA